VCGGFLSVERINENFNVYRAAAAAAGRKVGPNDLAIRRLLIVDEDGDAAALASRPPFAPIIAIVGRSRGVAVLVLE